jgi:hypothetical protein
MRIQREEAAIGELAGKQARLQQPGDDKLSMYRQQALIVSRKKQVSPCDAFAALPAPTLPPHYNLLLLSSFGAAEHAFLRVTPPISCEISLSSCSSRGVLMEDGPRAHRCG